MPEGVPLDVDRDILKALAFQNFFNTLYDRTHCFDSIIIDHLSRMEGKEYAMEKINIQESFLDKQLFMEWPMKLIPQPSKSSTGPLALIMFMVPRVLIGNDGKHIWNNYLQNVLTKYDVRHKITTPYHPQTRGQHLSEKRAHKGSLEGYSSFLGTLSLEMEASQAHFTYLEDSQAHFTYLEVSQAHFTYLEVSQAHLLLKLLKYTLLLKLLKHISLTLKLLKHISLTLKIIMYN
ncbi:hypothetical protein CR513_03556, partial [Mucuna pruriens]